MDEWIKKKKYIYFLQYGTAWMKLGVIILIEIGQSQKNKYCLIPLTYDVMFNFMHQFD